MCGIAGCVLPGKSQVELKRGVSRMLTALEHRGPDDLGLWVDEGRGLALGHRRLAIRDRSPAGHQPMFTADGTMGLVYNGELYNVAEMRARLGRHDRCRGHSDTEVLLRSIEVSGLSDTVKASAGMFAFALWNRIQQTVTLVRDRLGIKPLYYAIQDNQLIWASELKALIANPNFHAEINPTALRHFLRFGYVPAPYSILRQTWKLRPGTALEFRLSDLTAPRNEIYWDAADAAQTARERASSETDDEAVVNLHELLETVVRQHLVSDVPVGAFLSGGVDSSLIVAMMQAVSPRPVRTFSIGFEETEFNEAPYAQSIARQLGTDHDEHYVSTRDIADCVPRWAEFYCEPFSDTSSLPSLIVSHRARQHVTVALTGDGGDEIFAGYGRYRQTLAIHRRIQRVPHVIRRTLRMLLSCPSNHFYQRLQPLQTLVASHIREGIAESARKTHSLLSTRCERELYECMASISFDANRSGLLSLDALDADDDAAHSESPNCWQPGWNLLDNMQLWDSQIYLPNDILHKVDMASMSVGLEVRVPLLDHRLYEFAWSLPDHLRFAGGQGKLLLRKLLGDFVPPTLFERPKRGFSAPLDGWLRGPLRDWAESLLTESVVGASGLLNATTVHEYWQDLISHRAGHARIWPVLVFLAWQQQYLQPSVDHDEHRLRDSSNDPVFVGSEP